MLPPSGVGRGVQGWEGREEGKEPAQAVYLHHQGTHTNS